MTKVTLAVALALTALAAAPASAAPPRYDNSDRQGTSDTEHTCGFPGLEYDASGVPKGPYCH
jgi:hypothetical protein